MNGFKEKICSLFKNGGNIVGTLALKIYGESINEAGTRAFSEAIELGISITIAALYDAKVDDEMIIHVVHEHWGIEKEEIIERLLYCKTKTVKESLIRFLKLQNYSSNEIDLFIKDNAHAIRYDSNLLKIKDNPEKLYNELKKAKDRKKV